MNYRKEFLDHLPFEPIKRVILKIIILFIAGYLFSLLSISLVSYLIKINNEPDYELPFFVWVLIQDIPFLLLTFILFYRKRASRIFSGIYPRVKNNSPLLFIFFILANFLISLLLTLLAFNVEKNPENREWLEYYINTEKREFTLSYLYVLFFSTIAYLLTAFSEEFVFRFTLYRFLRKYHFLAAVLYSSIIFTGSHGGFNVNTFIFGVILGLYYEYSNNFFGAVLMHAVNNQFLVFATYYLTYLFIT